MSGRPTDPLRRADATGEGHIRRQLRVGTWLAALGALLTVLALGGCSSLSYYAQSVSGQIDLLSRRQDIDTLLSSPAASERLKQRLRLVRELRRFAASRLDLPADGSYTTYADLERPYAVATVVATPALSLTPLDWCFPVVGCLSYRGYFDETEARRFASTLGADGLDVHVGRVRAYSTLGWFEDPVLNTIVYLPDSVLAGIIFHELTHQRLYIAGDTAFNEAYAVAVAQYGVTLWLDERNDPREQQAHAQRETREAQFRALALATRARLQSVYEGPADDADKRLAKSRILDEARNAYARLKLGWGGYAGYDRWFDKSLNNARLALLATYHELVPGFARLLARNDFDISAFHAEVARFADLPPDERRARLLALANPQPARLSEAGQGADPTDGPAGGLAGSRAGAVTVRAQRLKSPTGSPFSSSGG
ncbi:MAG: aminopeptidase [Gammaproteobacteria bacterium]|nr:aminopeptidase [Gammaproteobacteria bacterium]